MAMLASGVSSNCDTASLCLSVLLQLLPHAVKLTSKDALTTEFVVQKGCGVGGGGQTADTIVKRSKTSGLLLYPVLYWQLRFLGYIDDGSVQLDRNRNIAWYMGKRKE